MFFNCLNYPSIPRKREKELGGKLLVALNFCDLLICSLSAILIPTFTSLLYQKKNVIQLFYANNDTTEMQETDAISILIKAMKTFRIYDITYNVAFYVPFQLFVVMSCVLTVILLSLIHI